MNMRRFFIFAIALGALSLLFLPSFNRLSAQQQTTKSAIDAAKLSQAEIDRIINAFTAKEAEYRKALNNYAFRRDAVLQDIGMGGQITGEYHRVSNFTFDDSGNRFEKI